jgi:signal transduction histidine kinase
VRRRVLLAFVGVVVVVLAALEVPLGVQHARTERRDLAAKVEHDAVTLASLAQASLPRPSATQLRAVAAIAYRYARTTGGRVVIVDRHGIAVIDTAPSGSGVESFRSRPEIAAALRGVVASGTRHSRTLRTDLLYVAVPVAAAGRIHGAVRITYPTSAIDQRVRRYWLILAAIAGIVLAATTIVGFRVATFVVRPLRRVEAAAAAVGDGDLSARAPEETGPEEVRSLARVFNTTVARVAQLLRAQRDFIADASHQLRTPLTALGLRLENLERDVAPSGRDDLDGALREVERLSGIVDGLLALARADAPAVAPQRLDLTQLVGERVDAWTALASEHGVRLVADAPAAVTARAGPARVAQVIDNLIDNAVEASPSGGTVRVAARADGSWATVTVTDEGQGLGDEERERAFDRFWRGRSGDGTGLGLAIVRSLVEADGGEAELVRADGGGLQAVVRLRSD